MFNEHSVNFFYHERRSRPPYGTRSCQLADNLNQAIFEPGVIYSCEFTAIALAWRSPLLNSPRTWWRVACYGLTFEPFSFNKRTPGRSMISGYTRLIRLTGYLHYSVNNRSTELMNWRMNWYGLRVNRPQLEHITCQTAQRGEFEISAFARANNTKFPQFVNLYNFFPRKKLSISEISCYPFRFTSPTNHKMR